MSYKNKKVREAYMKKYRQDHRNALKQWRKDNPEHGKVVYRNRIEYLSKWKKDNADKMKDYREKWNRKNPGYNSQYGKNRRRKDLKFNLNYKMVTAIRKALKGNKKGRKWEALVGYTLNDLVKRLKKTMPEGYTWEDFLTGKLHIDHKIPISAFNYTKPEHTDFKRCWALKNLRLLPAKENWRKSNKLQKPFQPSLKITSFTK